MLGIISESHEIGIIDEFFQLFKTPWEFYQAEKSYDVVIATDNRLPIVNAKVVIIYDSLNKKPYKYSPISEDGCLGHTYIEYGGTILPVYGNIHLVEGKGQPIIWEPSSLGTIGLKTGKGARQVFQVGYDLFYEVWFLLTNGQPSINAKIPTLELHIALLRNMILEAGIPIIEIPPIPAGHEFITCLTHDVDFVRISHHKFDHTLFGFLYRATWGTLKNCIKKRSPWNHLFKNLFAVITLPFVFLGLRKDFWLQFDRYMAIEKNHPSTYFFIPFKNRTGCDPKHRRSIKRATKYDILDVKSEVEKLQKKGDEIGLHGIDAWHNKDLAGEELERISQVFEQSKIGVRMHWLCFNQESYKILDGAGFDYDSTYGYNDAIGFKGGTAQAFQPLEVNNLIEMPMIVQDNPLFIKNGNRLTISEIREKCNSIIETIRLHGGVLTTIWHQRSLAPERLYDEFYVELLRKLREKHNTWFATGEEVVSWFRGRREFDFKNLLISDNRINIRYSALPNERVPPLILRIYCSKNIAGDSSYKQNNNLQHHDFPITGNQEITFL